MVVSVLLKIKFGHAQISVPKIGIPMPKTAYNNLCSYIHILIYYLTRYIRFCAIAAFHTQGPGN